MEPSTHQLVRREGGPFAALMGSLGSLPPGENPFQYLLSALQKITVFAKAQGSFRANVIAMGVLFGVAFILNILALVLPIFGGRGSWSMHLWVARLKHHRNQRVPSLVPNGRFFASFFAAISSVFMINSTVLIVTDPRKLNGGLLLLPLIPLWLVSYMACFDALFVVWISPISQERSRTDVLKNPWLLNALCWLVPVAVIVAGSYYIARVWQTSSLVIDDLSTIAVVLQNASASFEADGGGSINMAPLFGIATTAGVHYARYQDKQRADLLLWVIMFAFSTGMFFTSLFLLVKTVWPHLGLSRRPTLIRRRSSFDPASGATSRPPVDGDATKATRRSYRLLILYFTVLAALSTCLLAGVVCLYVNSDRIVFDVSLYHRTLYALFWPIVLILCSIGALSLSRVLERRRGSSVSGSAGATTFFGSAGPPRVRAPCKVGLFGTGSDSFFDEESTAVASTVVPGEGEKVGGSGPIRVSIPAMSANARQDSVDLIAEEEKAPTASL